MSEKKRVLRLGLFGGTFDPVHLGHLLFAQDALEQLRLDAMLFIPCRQSPHKKKTVQASDLHRLAMLRAALRKEKQFWISRCELDRPAPSYAIDTVEEIKQAFPRAKLYWLIGADQLARLGSWHQIKELKKQVQFLVEIRGDTRGKKLPSGVLSLPRPRRVDISATEIRYRVKQQLPVRHLVPAPVAAYITRHRLYLS